MASPERIPAAFQNVWEMIFKTSTHLDSALSKQNPSIKSILAQITPVILLRPTSTAAALGVGVAPGEPWNLSRDAIATWRTAALLAERIHATLEGRILSVEGEMEDFPPAMIEEWESTWGRAKAEELAKTLTQGAPLSLRATSKLGAEALLKRLKAGSELPVKAQVSDFAPFGVRLAGYAPVLQTSLYKEGAFEIQDEGSQIMALFALWPELFGRILTSEPGAVSVQTVKLPSEIPAWTVVDACAGAGGKSLSIADALGGKGRVFAYDTSAGKLSALKRRATNAGLNNIQSVAVTEGKEDEVVKRFRARPNVVLVDAPCSGWGVLRRNPDIKWRQDRETLARMPQIQKRILQEYAPLVAPGGRLIFGVCTFRKAETTEIVQSFLDANPEFEKREGGFLGPGPSDGFFMQAFQKQGK